MKLPKILVIIISVVCIFLVVISLGIFILIKMFDIKKFQPQIISQVENVLGREVSLKDLSLSFSFANGLVASIEGLQVLDDPAFSKKNFFSVSQARLKLDLIPTITKREVFVSSIEFIDPSILIVRNDQGVFNFQTFKFLDSSSGAAQPAAVSPGVLSTGDLSSAAAIPLVFIKNVAIKNGTLNFVDNTGDEPMAIEVSKIFFGINNFSLNNVFDFVLEAAVFSDEKNIKVDGRVKIDLGKPVAYLRDTKFKLNLESLSLEKIAAMLPAIKQIELKKNLAGEVFCSIDLMEISPEKMTIVYLKGGIENGKIESGRLKEPLHSIVANVEIKEDNVSIDQISAKLGDGNILAKGSVLGYQKDQQYDISLDASNVDLGKTVYQGDQDIKLLGLLSTSAEIKGTGFSSLLAFQPKMGRQNLTLKEGKLENINVLKVVLSQLNFAPDLVQKLEQNLPEKYKEKLKQKDTPLTNVIFASYIEDNKIYLDSVSVATDIFSLEGKGTLDFDLNADIQARIIIPQDLSQSMVDSIEEFSYLIDENKEIVIPVMIKGKAPDKLSYFPDLEYIGKRLLKNKGRQELQKVLGKVLKTGGGSDESSGSGEGEGESNQNPSPEEQIIGNVLDMIFK
ncbi:MAG: AsmA-like C-terminal region-containing protein [Candidatus Omnitrophica bacterium]|nr:AsmA-like C-terminal region-containing protein [Candidatus Omnitrophota bacterium]